MYVLLRSLGNGAVDGHDQRHRCSGGRVQGLQQEQNQEEQGQENAGIFHR